MCDDLEEINRSVYDEPQTDAGPVKKNVPNKNFGNIKHDPDIVQKADTTKNIQTERQQSEAKQPNDKFLINDEPKEIIVHSPE